MSKTVDAVDTALKQRKKRVVGIPFKKGDERINRHGRPLGTVSIADMLKRIGAELVTLKSGERKTKFEIVLQQLYNAAVTGNIRAAEFIADRTEGKAKQSLELITGQKVIVAEEIIDAGSQANPGEDPASQQASTIQGKS